MEVHFKSNHRKRQFYLAPVLIDTVPAQSARSFDEAADGKRPMVRGTIPPSVPSIFERVHHGMKAGAGLPWFRRTGRDQPTRQVAMKIPECKHAVLAPGPTTGDANGLQQSLRSKRRRFLQRVRQKWNGIQCHGASSSRTADLLKERCGFLVTKTWV